MSEEVVEPVVEPTSAPAEPTTPVSIVGENGNWNPEYLASLPDDLGNHSSFQKYKTVEDYVKGSINSQRLVGQKAEEFWKSEEADIVAKRREIMGIPTDATGYELSKPEDMPDEIPFNVAEVDAFKSIAADVGLTQEQAAKLLEWDTGRAVEKFNQIGTDVQAQMEQAESQLKGDWGNKYQYNLAKVKQATDFLGITDTLNETGLANSPEVLKMVFDKLVPAISDDKLIEGSKADNYATMEDELNEIDNKLLKMDRNDPAGKPLLKRKMELLEKLA